MLLDVRIILENIIKFIILAQEIYNIKIPKTYKKIINNLVYRKFWKTIIIEEIFQLLKNKL
jgi:hypothetical protein